MESFIRHNPQAQMKGAALRPASQRRSPRSVFLLGSLGQVGFGGEGRNLVYTWKAIPGMGGKTKRSFKWDLSREAAKRGDWAQPGEMEAGANVWRALKVRRHL
ncbi:unnamed protein product [Caretta caretta]